jgi:hypothetical protein
MASMPTRLEGALQMERVRLDRGGYDPHGRYFRVGAPLFRAWEEGGGVFELRAKSMADAKAQLRARYPGVRFRMPKGSLRSVGRAGLRRAIRYPPWRSTYSNDAFDRAQALANKLTDEDRRAGRAAPAHGYSDAHFRTAEKVVNAAAEAFYERASKAHRAKTRARKSRGHIAFVGDTEYFDIGGQVYSAGRHLPIADIEHKTRHGRWAGSRAHFDRNREHITGETRAVGRRRARSSSRRSSASPRKRKWSAKVTRSSRYHPPPGLFLESAHVIADRLAQDSTGPKQAIARVTFYINRAGRNLKPADVRRLKDAAERLRELSPSLYGKAKASRAPGRRAQKRAHQRAEPWLGLA